MSESIPIYGYQTVLVRDGRVELADKLRENPYSGTVEFWQDGCVQLMTHWDFIPTYGSEEWGGLARPGYGPWTWTPDKDYWIAPEIVESIVMWIVPREKLKETAGGIQWVMVKPRRRSNSTTMSEEVRKI